MTALKLTEVRPRAATLLAPAAPGDPPVIGEMVDSLTPPALLLEWADPWIVQETIGGGIGLFYAALNVLCVAGRIEPGPGFDTLEQLVDHVIGRLQPEAWPLTLSQSPARFDINNIPMLGTRLGFRVPVSVNGGN